MDNKASKKQKQERKRPKRKPPKRTDASREGIDFKAGHSWGLKLGFKAEFLTRGSGPINLLSEGEDSRAKYMSNCVRITFRLILITTQINTGTEGRFAKSQFPLP